MIKNILFLKKNNLIIKLSKFKSYFITTPIYYSNEKPHIGHFYTNCIADSLARWNRIKGDVVIFSTGTDDHGLKIQRAANNKNIIPKELVDDASNNFKNLFLSADISFTKFIRTSDSFHKANVQNIWKQLMLKGLFTKQTYSGWYSAVDETFVSKNTIKKSSSLQGNLDQQQKSLEWYEEENWVFNIVQFKDQIRNWVNNGAIYPSNLISMINDFINETDEVSLSRPTSRVQWGIQVPNDDTQTIYVWFDALLNYITATKLSKQPCWPVDMQIIGKDIVRFHTVLWPAILLALEMDLPKKILIHSHWLQGGVKMSKSLGNVVDPQEESETLGGYEQLKYFLLSEDAINDDSTYNRQRAILRINHHLVNVTGNLLSRITGRKLNPLQTIGIKDEITSVIFTGSQFPELLLKLSNLRCTFENHIESLQIHLAIQSVIDVLRDTNGFVESQKPWLQSTDQYTKDAVIYVASESLRMCAILLQCFIPSLAHKILTRLSVPVKSRSLIHVEFLSTCPKIRDLTNLKEDFILLKKLE